MINLDITALSTVAVLVAEIGDKTQLLALMLAARYRRPLPIILGILVATIANHGAAAGLGVLLTQALGPTVLRWAVGLSFLGMAGWMLIPDKADDDLKLADKAGPFIATLIAFFLVEIGDKTQVVTIVLAARYQDLLSVTAGTTLGMMLADVPAVFIGDFAGKALPVTLIHRIAAGLFAILGLLALSGWGL